MTWPMSASFGFNQTSVSQVPCPPGGLKAHRAVSRNAKLATDRDISTVFALRYQSEAQPHRFQQGRNTFQLRVTTARQSPKKTSGIQLDLLHEFRSTREPRDSTQRRGQLVLIRIVDEYVQVCNRQIVRMLQTSLSGAARRVFCPGHSPSGVRRKPSYASAS